jgi:4a-hydroxytetrahydrobiopterin dehydratase
MVKLTKDEIEENLKHLKNWSYKENIIVRYLKLKDFSTAIKFINAILPIAEELEHHPDIEIKNYNEIVIRLTTHDEGGVTQYDFQLAKRIEELVKDFSS